MRLNAVLLVILCARPGYGQDAPVVPPVAKKVPHALTLHGETLTDDYFWLTNKENPEVIKHLQAENAYAKAATARLRPLQNRLTREMNGRTRGTDRTVPVRENGYWYYSRTDGEYPTYCRKKGTLEAPEEIILDAKALAKGKKFLDVGDRKVSDDGTLLAYTLDFSGGLDYELSVKDLRTGKVIESGLVRTPAVEWAADNKTLFYLTEDGAKRAHKVWRHVVGEPRDRDALVYEEKDEAFVLDLSRSRDGKYVFQTAASYTSAEQRYVPADRPVGEWKTILPRKEGHEYDADHRDGRFYIYSNLNALNFRIASCPVDNPDPAGWRDLVAHDSDVLLEGLTLFQDFAVVAEREDARPHIRVVDLRSAASFRLDFTEPVYKAEIGENPEFKAAAVRVTYSSPVTPETEYEYDLATGARKLLQREAVAGGFDPTAYETERTWATSKNGVKVPVSLVFKKGLKRDGTAACLLYGYGAYGMPTDTEFDPGVFSLLDRGVVYAWAHVRGSSDLGRGWYDAGKMLRKQNSFTDFIACADHLVQEKYCARDRLAIMGESAGGLLIGAVLNRRPDLCKAAVLGVPFVDVINSMADGTVPLTVPEFQQWGNPKKKTEYEYMKQYCPYTNLRAAAYPAVLVTAGLNDSLVMYHEPAKYVAKLRAVKTDKNPVLFRCNMDAGHDGASGRNDARRERAFVFAFVLDQLGCDPKK